MDDLPEVNIVPQNLRNAIHAHTHVNLALLLIPGMDNDSDTKIIDHAGNQVIVRSNDPRAARQLNIHEFRVAFSRYKNVICEKEPQRRHELDAYSDLIDDMFITYGASHFYDYHTAFSWKAEQYQLTMDVPVNWAFRDTGLYLCTFSGLRSTSCDLCTSSSHYSEFCPQLLGTHHSATHNKKNGHKNTTSQNNNNVNNNNK